MGVAPAGQASLRFAVTAPAGASAYDFGRPLDGTGFTQLADTLSTIMADPTRHAGAMLAPFGIGYVVAGTADLPPGAAARLNQQLDLVGTQAAGLSIFRDEVTVPLASLVADPAWRAAAASPDPAAAAMLRTPDAIPLSGSDGSYVGGPLGSRKIPPGSMVLLSQQFDRHWVLSEPRVVTAGLTASLSSAPSTAAATVAPRAAFGWAVGFAYSPTPPSGFAVRFTGQSTRTAEVVLLALLWTAALWITRRRSRAD
jgi:hypothetical protein